MHRADDLPGLMSGKLPVRGVTQFDGLRAESQFSGASRGEMDLTYRHLCRQAQCIRCRGAVRDDHFSRLVG
jgi:hypothetical protein